MTCWCTNTHCGTLKWRLILLLTSITLRFWDRTSSKEQVSPSFSIPLFPVLCLESNNACFISNKHALWDLTKRHWWRRWVVWCFHCSVGEECGLQTQSTDEDWSDALRTFSGSRRCLGDVIVYMSAVFGWLHCTASFKEPLYGFKVFLTLVPAGIVQISYIRREKTFLLFSFRQKVWIYSDMITFNVVIKSSKSYLHVNLWTMNLFLKNVIKIKYYSILETLIYTWLKYK